MKAVNYVIIILVAFVAAAIVYFLTSARITELEVKVHSLEQKLRKTNAQLVQLEKRQLELPPAAKAPVMPGKVVKGPKPEHPGSRPSKFDGMKKVPSEED